ncbi:MAG TPA: hypothetical protein VKQ08_04440 [Cyclobacteriaceae bacterium]|nr:hypothetical protein [Cyclobacteriaceae bacterium]
MKNPIKSILLIIILTSFTLSSCGVMFGGSKFSASIIAKDHPNAQIFVNGSKIGQGTAIGLYNRKRPLTVELKQDGCEPKRQTFDNTFRTGSFIASIISWGLTGMVVDLATGACYKPDHKRNPDVQRMSDKNYVFTVDYSGCPK